MLVELSVYYYDILNLLIHVFCFSVEWMMWVFVVQDLEPQNASSIISDVEEGMENNSGRNAALSLPLAAFDFVTRLASGFFSGRRKNIDPIDLDSKGENELQPEGRDFSHESSSQKSNVLDNFSGESVNEKGEEHVDEKAHELSLPSDVLCNVRIEDSDSKTGDEDDTCSFKRFDTAKDPLDHYFLGANGQVYDFLYINIVT